MPEDITLYNSKIIATSRSVDYWNFFHHEYLWHLDSENYNGEIEIPAEVWDRVQTDDKCLIIGFFDTLASTWYFPPIYVVPSNHRT